MSNQNIIFPNTTGPKRLVREGATSKLGGGAAAETADEFVIKSQLDAKVPYLSYVPIFTQTGTDDPVVIALQNTISDDLVWSRVSVGLYKCTGTGAFPNNKTHIAGFSNFYGSAASWMHISSGSAIVGYWTIYTVHDGSAGINDIYVEVRDAAFAPTEFSTIFNDVTDALYLPEVRVYP